METTTATAAATRAGLLAALARREGDRAQLLARLAALGVTARVITFTHEQHDQLLTDRVLS